MYITKKIITKFVISLTAGVASTVGIRLTNVIFDKTVCNDAYKKQKLVQQD